MFDIVIKDGIVIDGSGAPGQKLDIGIRGEKIEALGNLSSTQAAEVIEAGGKVVSPGFIDIHSHADFVLPALPTADSKLHQGITLEVVGNCGVSVAPVTPETQEELAANLLFSVSLTWDWDSLASYLERLSRVGTAVNVMALVGHGTLRLLSMGMLDAAPTPQQLEKMKDEVRRAMEEGAVGLSTGLIYPPSVYAGTDEIVELAKVAAERGGYYASHIRGEGDTVVEALEEAIEIGRRANIPVQVSHLKAEYRSNWHKMAVLLEKIEQARREGVDVTADMYTYPAVNTGLSFLLPPWAHVGGRSALLRRLQDKDDRLALCRQLKADADRDGPDHWERTFISSCPPHPEYEGRHIAELAQERHQPAEEALLDILLETQGNADSIQFLMSEENVELGLSHPQVMIGTDGEGRAAEGPFSAGKPHPRNYGGFPRLLAKYVRERKLMPIEEAVRKMTGLPAARLKLRDRGLIKRGYYADLVIFDPQTITDRATFSEPHQYPAGIDYVLVNGRPAIVHGNHSGVLAGKVITH